jgi:hypothetical protein
VYEPTTLKATDLADLLVAVDPSATQYLKAGHSYLQAKRWVNSGELLVALYGHFDDPPLGGFTLQYRIGLDGHVQKISQLAREKPE